jgi:hypothetical protein
MQTALAELSQIATGQRAASSVARHPEMSDALQKIVGIADWKSIETKFRPS